MENGIYPSENKKKHFLSRTILVAVFVVCLGALGYIYYFNPTLLNPNENSPAKNPAAQNDIKADSLNGGGTGQIADNSQSLTSDISGAFSQQLENLQTDIQFLENKFNKINLADKLSLAGGEITGELEIADKLTLNDTAKTEDLIPKSDDQYDLGSEDKGFNNAYIHKLWGSSILTIGNDDTSHSLSNNDDVLVSGDLEVNGATYFDGSINLNGNLISNLADPVNDQDAVTKAYYEANTPTGVFSRSGTTISPTTSGDTLNLTNSLLTFDSSQLFGGSSLTELGFLSGLSGLGTLSEQNADNVAITGGLLSGITGLNNLTGTKLSFLENISSDVQTQISGKQNTLSAASGSTDGYLSSTNWTTFNDKQPAGDYITASGAPVQTVAGRSGTVTLAQADISGLTTSDSPTFAGMTINGIANMSNYAIQNIGAAGTNFSGTGGLTLADALVVSSGGANITGLGTFNTGIDVTGTGTFNDNVDIMGLLGVTGDTTLTGDLDVTGDAIFTGDLSITGDSSCQSLQTDQGVYRKFGSLLNNFSSTAGACGVASFWSNPTNGGTETNYCNSGTTITYTTGFAPGDSVRQGDGYLLNFTGYTDQITIADNSNLTFDTDLGTISFWIKMADTTTPKFIMFKDTSHGLGSKEEFLIQKMSGALLFNLFDDSSGGNCNIKTTTALANNVWYHITYSANVGDGGTCAANVKVYVNGVDDTTVVQQDASFAGIEDGDAPFIIKNLENGSQMSDFIIMKGVALDNIGAKAHYFTSKSFLCQ